ncbi:CDF family Co(II)/Ni(II) efflux transporter DmeF [Lichenihabitans psoromatis]|uniref:CDF family Co(II)/Ni(II) efflux transporter DmeF n=1 Tax=Lichenihabitans psoromatis TaxID=2528642 RepID=UPI001036C09E|nr:CDF family Co(II)/Ni(II) efflux transporter DmeF [Lichenihabitans psoromatis]
MTDSDTLPGHSHVFLGEGHAANQKRTWAVIALCAVMMIGEIVGGLLFGSIALVADGLHMSTHAGALLLAALAYSFASRHATDRRFTFGTGKLGDLAGFSSAIVLAMIALLIGYEAVSRLFAPVPIQFYEAIPIACFGLIVNIASVWLLSGSHDHHHGHRHNHRHGHDDHHAHDEEHRLTCGSGTMALSIFEDGVPPRFRVRIEGTNEPRQMTVETVRSDGTRQLFQIADKGAYLESIEDIPEPHAFEALVRYSDSTGQQQSRATFAEHGHAEQGTHRDNNMRAAVIHVMADAAVSVLVIVGLLLARTFGWLWMDPLAGIVGACVIASWSYGLLCDTGAILLDMVPDTATERGIRQTIETDGDRLQDLHLWRLGPGHLGAIVVVATREPRGPAFYREQLSRFRSLSHVTVEVQQLQSIR